MPCVGVRFMPETVFLVRSGIRSSPLEPLLLAVIVMCQRVGAFFPLCKPRVPVLAPPPFLHLSTDMNVWSWGWVSVLPERWPHWWQPTGIDLTLSSHRRSMQAMFVWEIGTPYPSSPWNLWNYHLEILVNTVSTLRSKYKSITTFEREF